LRFERRKSGKVSVERELGLELVSFLKLILPIDAVWQLGQPREKGEKEKERREKDLRLVVKDLSGWFQLNY